MPEVASGALPPVASRLPREPALAELETIGRPGGELRMLMASPKDTRLMVVYGYARLVAYTPALALVPDMLEGVDVEDGRIFTLRLRAGHKWSDGQPFTSEDFRYWFEDVAENPKLSPAGLPMALLPNGERAAIRGVGRANGPLQLVAPQPAVPAGAGRSRPAVHLLPGALPEAVPCRNTPIKRPSMPWSRRQASETGQHCTAKWARCTAMITPICRRSSPGY